MEKSLNLGVHLMRTAAEAIAEAINGCAALLSLNQQGGASVQGLLGRQPNAINHFGPLIVARWTDWLSTLNEEKKDQAIQQLAALDSRTASQTVRAVIDKFASIAQEDKQVAIEYLTAVPTSARSVLIPDQESGRMVVARTTTLDERVLLRLLPVNAPPFSVGSEIPGTPYRIEEFLGGGGFGVVYKASNRFEQNTSPRAIKFCLNPAMIATLHRERELLDRLMAAGAEVQWSDRIVKLYGHNLDAVLPFLVYEYVPGGSLIGRLAAIRKQTGLHLRPTQVLGLIRRICEAVAFAHTRGLVHRDLKPSNILVNGNTIKLADFGIGGVIASFAAQTSQHGGDLSMLSASEKNSIFRGAGTPLYMSPEQRQGERPDPRHDIFSIGVMWYHFLIGDFSRELHPGWAEELADEYDVPQKQIDLIQQCVGYLKKRPATAKDLLEMFPPPTLPQLPSMKMARPGESKVLGSHDGRVTCLAFFRDSRRLLSGANDGTARLWDVEGGRELASFRMNSKTVLSAAISPDNRRALFGGDDRNAWVRDLVVHGIDPRCLAGHIGAVTSVAFAPDGRRAATGSRDGSIRVWHVASGREMLRIEETGHPITAIAFTPDGLLIVSCSEDGALRLWDTETGWAAQELTSSGGWLLSVAVSPDGRKVVCGGKNNLTLWSLEDGQSRGSFEGHTLPVMSVAFSPSGQWLLSGSLDKSVWLWDVNTRRQIYAFEGHSHGVNAVAFAPDGLYAASAGDDRTIRLWAMPQLERPSK